VGLDKGSLTEQQTKENSKNNNNTDKGKTQHKKADSREKLSLPATAARSRATTPSRHAALPPIGTPV